MLRARLHPPRRRTRSPVPPGPGGRARVGALLAGAAATVLGGCGVPPELDQPSSVPTVAPSGATGSVPPLAAPTGSALYPPGSLPDGSLPGGGLPGGPFPTLPGGQLPGTPLPGGQPPGAPLPPPAVTPLVPPVPTLRGPSAAVPAPRCAARPTAAQIIAAVRSDAGLLPADVQLRVADGPYCAGSWQYAVVRVVTRPEPEPLRVVTRGTGPTLTLVTAGTDVCSAPVRTGAPAGIQTLACDGGTQPGAARSGG